MNKDLPELDKKRNIVFTIEDGDKEHTNVQVAANGFGIVPEDKASDIEKDTNKLRISKMITESIYAFTIFMNDLGLDKKYVIETVGKIYDQLQTDGQEDQKEEK